MLEMSGQLRQELPAVRVLGEVLEAPLHQHVAALEVARLLGQGGVVVVALPHVRRQAGRGLEEGPGLLHPPLPHLQHPEVVVTLRVVVVSGEGELEALVGQVHVPDAEGEMGHVIPDLGQDVLVLGDVEGALETGDGHVVLLGVEAAQTEVVVELRRGDPHLQQPPVISEAQLGLVGIEMVHPDAGNGLHVGRVLGEDILVIFSREAEVTQGLLDPGHIDQEVHVVGKVVQTGSVDLKGGQRLVQAEVDLAELEEGRNHRLLLDG